VGEVGGSGEVPGSQGQHLLADRPLLALMERPGSGRDLVMDGILTEPLNTARLSWGRGFIGRSFRICIPSPGPMCAMWLKLVGLEINLFLISGSRSISLLCCILSSSGTLKEKRRLLLMFLTICFRLLSDVSGTTSSSPSVRKNTKNGDVL